jgi:hypothetical protein
MSDILKGNYKLTGKDLPASAAAAAASSEQTFEAQALQKLGGSIAFIKKSSSFVWSGGKKDDARPKAR